MIIEYVRKGGSKRFQRKVKDGKKVPIKVSRTKGGHKIGVLLAVPIDNKIYIGWSLCNLKAGDRFDPQLGIDIASGRALRKTNDPIAASMVKRAMSFVGRAKKYYQNREVEVAFKWGGQPSKVVKEVPVE